MGMHRSNFVEEFMVVVSDEKCQSFNNSIVQTFPFLYGALLKKITEHLWINSVHNITLTLPGNLFCSLQFA